MRTLQKIPLGAVVGLFALVSAGGVADARLTSAQAANVTFNAAGPAGMKITGTTSDLRVADDGQNIAITVALGQLTTGIDLRDRHMREKYLEVPTYPTALLTVARSALTIPAAGAPVDANVSATMTLHGKSQPVSVHYTASRDGTTLHITGTTHIKMGDFNITAPTYLGLTVKPDVDVAVRFDATDTP